MTEKTLQEKMFLAAGDEKLFEQAKTYALQYMHGIYERRVFPEAQALAGLSQFDEDLPQNAQDGAEVLRQLHQYGSPATVATTAGRYFGMVTGSAYPPVLAVKWLADVWDQLAALTVTSPVTSKLEAVCEKWLLELFGLPSTCRAGFVSGTSMATFCGLAAARYHLLTRAGWDVNAQGLFGAPPFRVVVGAEAHSTVFKALTLLGLGKDRVELVPVDEQGRMDATRLPELDANTLLILQAGNVNSGSFDPLREIISRARAAGAWVHVDGAFGLWAAVSPQYQHLTDGFQDADSWSVDGHKTLNTPYDSGIVICKHPEDLVAALQISGSYILYGEQRDGMLYTPEMSRRNRAVELWATLKVLGREGIVNLVEGLCAHTQDFAAQMRARGFNIKNEVVFNQALVACDSPEQCSAMQQFLQQSGECWCGTARWRDTPVIRFSVCSWATTAADIERAVQAFVQAREACR
ncbi:MAG: aminotransferase class V-fold PLP-dependent enzyme [Anaerolineae bacterium]|nr:aminotransferase class V-fold PLP-dependent enzyme [Anaerolineae bacterium]